jgi:hypothetical protein
LATLDGSAAASAGAVPNAQPTANAAAAAKPNTFIMMRSPGSTARINVDGSILPA